MEQKYFLVLAKNTAQMILANRSFSQNGVITNLVPAPPESGTICAIAIQIKEQDLVKAKDIIESKNIDVQGIYEDKKLKLAKLLQEKITEEITREFIAIIKKIEEGDELDKEEIVYLLKTQKPKEIEATYYAADLIRKEIVGDVIEIRGAIEFSNICLKTCAYCGIGANVEGIKRFRMTEEEILEVVESLYNVGIKTVILQSGEDKYWTTDKIISIMKQIKTRFGMRITLSIGELTRDEYELLKNNGADNYLLKIETTNREIFKNLHPDDDYDHRIQCSNWLKELGYINGSGCIIGLPNQTEEDIASDIIYFKEMGINMIGIGPFIPAKGSALEKHPHGDIDMTLRAVAVTRIVCKKVYIPATTALASLDNDAQVMALKAGANSIMLINTPAKYRESYKLYNDKNMVDMDSAIYAVSKAGRKLPAYLKLDKLNI